ncbi:hypothetical protein [Weissella cibaria]|uniref:hypothetical protein n=1 Tax=Weissella cibaria TaxID=137591 RepID=UPI001191B218|nr:hypothetical protein [Weissella cibaria]TVV31767.1 hypothetical protein FO434_05765 [Weissella cibaria]
MSSKIKMTKEQKNVFDEALAECKDQPYDFTYFIDGLGMVDGYWTRTKNTPTFEKELNEYRTDSRWLMRAWLNPEDIEVEE